VDYTDEALREAVAQVRAATASLARLARAIDAQEPIRRRLDTQTEILVGVVAELERILDDAIDELL
jgi:hypothetical protein